jgi:thiamine biosynthesis lipoprotein
LEWEAAMAADAEILETAEAAARVVTLSAPAMACEFSIQLPSTESDRRWVMEAFEWIEKLEQQLSVYRETSELSALNRTAHDAPVHVEPQLYALLKRCRDWSRESDGAFDVTAGPLVKAWGFYQRQGVVPTEAALKEALAKVGIDRIRFDDERRTIQYPLAGMEINLGAVGKGYALDSVASRLKRLGHRSLLLGAGSSSILAVGRPPWDDAWTVDLRHPLNRQRPIALLRLKDTAMSTSGIAEQSFEEGGKRFGHVIDPRDGKPVEGMLQVTAVAESAAEAEALSTMFFVNGAAWTEAYFRRHANVGALLLPESRSEDVRMHLFGRMNEIVELPEANG